MSFTTVITRAVEDRFHGFLASVMQEVAPGVYLNPRLSPGIRQRIWDVMQDWFVTLGRGGSSGGSIIMAWADSSQVGGLGLLTLGLPPRTLVDVDGLLLVCRVP